MDSSAVKNRPKTQAKPMSELLPSLSGILSKDEMDRLTVKKQPRATMVQTRTVEKMKPLTLAEMRAEILVLKPDSPRRNQTMPSVKKGWNSSVKVDKKISHTAERQLKYSSVRKELNFQPKPKVIPTPRMQNIETPKFPKPESRAKKSLYHLQAKNSVRISGICNIPPTPADTKPAISKIRQTISNKENTPNIVTKVTETKPRVTSAKKEPSSAISLLKKVLAPAPKNGKIPAFNDITLNLSWKSGSDSSFLQKEKEIHEVEERIRAIEQEPTLEKISEVSPPVSTPFKEYRSVQDYFNNSSCLENSTLYNDNTIMCFDKPSICKDGEKREESVIVSLCDLFNKATVTNVEKGTTELDQLLEVEKETEKNIAMLESGIKMLANIKEAQVKSLQNVKRLIEEKRSMTVRKKNISDNDKTLVETKSTEDNKMDITLSPPKSPILSRPCSVIKSTRSPSYVIPKKNMSLRKKNICKSMPNVSGQYTPVKEIGGRALNMYMKLKEQMNYLSTPMVNRQHEVPDTPAITSHNLQKQLDKLFGS